MMMRMERMQTWMGKIPVSIDLLFSNIEYTGSLEMLL